MLPDAVSDIMTFGSSHALRDVVVQEVVGCRRQQAEVEATENQLLQIQQLVLGVDGRADGQHATQLGNVRLLLHISERLTVSFIY